ncbi:MAG: DUF881 domain-containing protein [Actinomycetota bacterium]
MRNLSTARPRLPRSGQIAVAIVVAVIGFLFVTQFRENRTLQSRLSFEREADLTQLLSDLSDRSAELNEEITDLRVQLAAAASAGEREKVLIDNARRELDGMRILLGLVPVEGEGIEISISDPDDQVGPDLLVDIIQELRDAGAEAIEVNGRRVVASTAFIGAPGALGVDGVAVSAPLRIAAIGARETLAEALRIAGGIQDAVLARRGASIRITERPGLRISSLHPLPKFSYATRS